MTRNMITVPSCSLAICWQGVPLPPSRWLWPPWELPCHSSDTPGANVASELTYYVGRECQQDSPLTLLRVWQDEGAGRATER